jgi:hypothetical protein
MSFERERSRHPWLRRSKDNFRRLKKREYVLC